MSRFIRSAHDQQNPYTVVNNNILRDKSISWAARGFLVFLLGLPEYWVLVHKTICESYGTSRHELDKMIKELIDVGYIRREKERKSGKFQSYYYEFSENKIFSTKLKYDTVNISLDPLGKPLPQPVLNHCRNTAAVKPHIRSKEVKEVKKQAATKEKPKVVKFSRERASPAAAALFDKIEKTIEQQAKVVITFKQLESLVSYIIETKQFNEKEACEYLNQVIKLLWDRFYMKNKTPVDGPIGFLRTAIAGDWVNE